MAGMTSQVSLQADQVGGYAGLSAQFSGAGFADMHFVVRALPPAGFRDWLTRTRMAGPKLDLSAYAALAAPSQDVKPTTYKEVVPGLFDAIVSATALSTPGVGSENPRDASAKRGG
jgi:cytochrome o ubiquinol oxidase subunit 2